MNFTFHRHHTAYRKGQYLVRIDNVLFAIYYTGYRLWGCISGSGGNNTPNIRSRHHPWNDWEDYHVSAGNFCVYHVFAGNFCDYHMSTGNFCSRLWNARGMWLATNYCDRRLRGQNVSNLGIPPQKQLVLVDLDGLRHGPCFFQFHGVLMKNARIVSWRPPWQILYLRLFAHWITNDTWMLHLCE